MDSNEYQKLLKIKNQIFNYLKENQLDSEELNFNQFYDDLFTSVLAMFLS